MNVIVCVDRNNGMMFHDRRQSRDRTVIQNIMDYMGDKTLWIHPYSASLFENVAGNICKDERFWEKVGATDYCFVENCHINDKNINKIILYRWDKKYPADVSLDVNLDKFILKETLEFKGYSHDKITREVYEKYE